MIEDLKIERRFSRVSLADEVQKLKRKNQISPEKSFKQKLSEESREKAAENDEYQEKKKEKKKKERRVDQNLAPDAKKGLKGKQEVPRTNLGNLVNILA